jgi:hypothetical protein
MFNYHFSGNHERTSNKIHIFCAFNGMKEMKKKKSIWQLLTNHNLFRLKKTKTLALACVYTWLAFRMFFVALPHSKSESTKTVTSKEKKQRRQQQQRNANKVTQTLNGKNYKFMLIFLLLSCCLRMQNLVTPNFCSLAFQTRT